jgi:hypothetical protein
VSASPLSAGGGPQSGQMCGCCHGQQEGGDGSGGSAHVARSDAYMSLHRRYTLRAAGPHADIPAGLRETPTTASADRWTSSALPDQHSRKIKRLCNSPD